MSTSQIDIEIFRTYSYLYACIQCLYDQMRHHICDIPGIFRLRLCALPFSLYYDQEIQLMETEPNLRISFWWPVQNCMGELHTNTPSHWILLNSIRIV